MIIIAQELHLELEEERKKVCSGSKEETKLGQEERHETERKEVWRPDSDERLPDWKEMLTLLFDIDSNVA